LGGRPCSGGGGSPPRFFRTQGVGNLSVFRRVFEGVVRPEKNLKKKFKNLKKVLDFLKSFVYTGLKKSTKEVGKMIRNAEIKIASVAGWFFTLLVILINNL